MNKTQPEVRLRYAQANVTSYREKWQTEHDRLRDVCWFWEDVVALAVLTYQRIIDLDSDVRESGFRNDLCQEDETEILDELRKLLQTWYRVSREVLTVGASVEREYGSVEKLSDLQAQVREAQGILTPDDQFFVSESIAQLRDQAIEEHRAGRTTGLLDDATSRP